MPDGIQDPSQDKDFLKAGTADQHAYLMSIDPEYAKAQPSDQNAYLEHLTGKTAPLAAGNERTNTGERLGGGGGAAKRPERQALVKEAGSPLAVPLVAGAHALEGDVVKREQQELLNAAKGTTPQARIPDEANIGLPQDATLPQTDRTVPFLERSGAKALRLGAGMLTPESLAISAALPAPIPRLVAAGRMVQQNAPALVRNLPGAVRGEPDAMGNALTAGAGLTGAATLGAAELAEGAPGLKAVARPISKVVEEAGGLKTLGIIKPEPVKALTQAIQPGVNIPRAQESLPIAGPDLQLVKQKGLVTDREGNPITEFKSNGDLLHGVRAAKQYIWNALEQRTGVVAKLSTDTSEVARAMENSISKRTAEQYPDLAKKVQARADTYRGMKTFRDIENAIQDANDDLRNYYKRSNATDSPITSETAATEAEVRALRSLLDRKVETLTGEGVADLKRRYGALRDVERAAAKQYAIETRQKGATLWEGLAALRAAGDFVSGNMLGAAKGAATLAVGRRLALVRSPAWLIDQAFQGPKAFDAAAEIPPPPGVKIAGALPPVPTPDPNIIQGQYAGEKPVKPIRVPGPNDRPIEMPANPQLPARPEGKGLPSGPEAKQLPPARSIQVGPSSLPPPESRIPPTLKREEFIRAPETSRATPPMSNAGALPPQLKAEIEREQGRPLTDEEAIRYDRLKSESAEPGNMGTVENIREPNRAKLEKPSRPEEKQTAPTIAKKSAAPKGSTDPVKELQDTKLQMRELEKRINGTQNAYKMKPLIERFRKLEARAEELVPQVKGGGLASIGAEKTGAGGAAAQTPAPVSNKPTPRTVSLSTYNSLTAEEKAVVDAQLAELPHLPQALREGRMRQLAGFGGPGTFLKERLARETIEQMRRTREPGED